ncbi:MULTISPECIES: hypothetical protein [unclassified Pseudoalteromonas]|uniref:hypothetical protein n=1 Tax=unclassified Pseudoalteromonas TaxID=194690 RepID=UPI0030153CCA
MKLNLVSQNTTLSADNKVAFTKAVKSRLKSYADNIRKVNVRLDELSSKSGNMTLCKVEVLLPGLPTLIVKAKGKTVLQALSRALKNSQQILAQSYFKLNGS